MYFISGYIWVILTSVVAFIVMPGEAIQVTLVSFFLQSLYLLTNVRGYRKKQQELVVPVLTLITLQMVTFLIYLLVCISKHWSVYPVFWTLLIFFGTLTIQVFEQRKYLKRLEQAQE
jgi:hypothetical protein